LDHPEKVNLAKRLIAAFKLVNTGKGGFWKGTPYKPLRKTALLPSLKRDELHAEFRNAGLCKA
jgi:hypothetical protein